MASPQEINEPSTSAEKLKQFYEARGSFEDLYVARDGEVHAGSVESAPKQPEIPPEPAAKPKSTNKKTNDKPTKTITTPAATPANTGNQSKRITRASTAANPSLLETPTPVAPPVASDSNAPLFTPNDHRKLKKFLKADPPVFGDFNSEYRTNHLEKYPGQQYQNPLNVPDQIFETTRAVTPPVASERDAKADLKAMGISLKSGKKHEAVDKSAVAATLNEAIDSSLKSKTMPTKQQAISIGDAHDGHVAAGKRLGKATGASKTANETQDLVDTNTNGKRPAENDADKPVKKRLKLISAADTVQSPLYTSKKATKRGADDTMEYPTAKRSKQSSQTSSGDSDSSDKHGMSGIKLSLGKNVRHKHKIQQAASNASDETSASSNGKDVNLELDQDDASQGASSESKAKKPRSTGEKIVPVDYVGNPSYHGFPTNPPPNATLSTPWQCAVIKCQTGLTWHHAHKSAANRGGSGKDAGAARKVTSQYFGRNKKSTGTIPNEVWHLKCRKHYQREDYVRKNDIVDSDPGSEDKSNKKKSKGKQEKKKNKDNNDHPALTHALGTLQDLEEQIERLELWRPQATFTVQLNTAGVKRLNEYNKLIAEDGLSPDRALESMTKVAEKKQNHNNSFSPVLLQHFSSTFAGQNKTYHDLRNILSWMRTEVRQQASPWICPMEFIIADKVKGEIEIDKTHNYQQWEAAVMGWPFDPNNMYQLPVVPLPTISNN